MKKTLSTELTTAEPDSNIKQIDLDSNTGVSSNELN